MSKEFVVILSWFATGFLMQAAFIVVDLFRGKKITFESVAILIFTTIAGWLVVIFLIIVLPFEIKEMLEDRWMTKNK